MKPEEVVPDVSMLMFVGKLASMETAASSNRSLVEVLHGMSRAPREKRADFICRETMVVTVNFIEQREQWDVQLRSFEAIYFLTIGAVDPKLWGSLELVPRMAKAAGKVREFAGRDPELKKRVDGLFELTMRTADMCLPHEILVKQLTMPDMDRYLMDLFAAEDKPPTLMQCASHLMTGLVQSAIGYGCYMKWRAMGLGEKLVRWFQNHKSAICSGDDPSVGGAIGFVSIGDAMDSILHFVIFAVEMDPDLVRALIADDVIKCIAFRILALAQTFKKGADGGVQDLSHLNVSFRSIAQLLTVLASNEHGLAAMGKLNLAIPLAGLLELPAEDFRIPVMIILCALCAHKDTCETLFKNVGFLDYMKRVEARVKDPGESPILPEELEYLVCILDRSCCYPDLAAIVQNKLIDLLFMLPPSAETMDTQVMSLRALARCAFVKPECLEMLPANGIACMNYMMSAISALRNASPEDPDNTASVL
eukprot:CAMPEP_0203895038 /NCGR_PEP_ID=MMETSP0359-20131031/37918_1 /ASSEMBLY_ACC=CAM_ASM_000338 /TAXON_ID=268821 /ORGANISM="Scrippsiella Hangoei, Strain SHTV-5" /LENGTH=478 /DNA_ID=CAMNT_0050817453 /DNA_START=50 /DNA_END=1483 /DNA_ORIENTATION=+